MSYFVTMCFAISKSQVLIFEGSSWPIWSWFGIEEVEPKSKASNFPLTYTFFSPSALWPIFKTQNCIGKEAVWSFPLEFSGANEIATMRILDSNSLFYLLLLMMSEANFNFHLITPCA